jgi:hypothetical protein
VPIAVPAASTWLLGLIASVLGWFGLRNLRRVT